MLTPTHNPRIQPRPLKSNLRASLRVSTKLNAFGDAKARSSKHRAVERSLSPASDRLSFGEEDFVDLEPEEFAIADIASAQLQSPVTVASPGDARGRPIFARSRQSISRITSLARRPRQRRTSKASSSGEDSHPEDSDQDAVAESNALILAFPQPPAALPVRLSGQSGAVNRVPAIELVSVDEPPAKLYDSDPFRKGAAIPASKAHVNPKLIPVSPLRVNEEILDPNCIVPSPPSTGIASPSTITPSLAVSTVALNPFRRTFERLRSTLTRGRTLEPHYNLAPEICQIFPADSRQDEGSSPHFSRPRLFLPELSFDSTPLADLIFDEHVSPDAVAYQYDGILQIPPPAAPLALADNHTDTPAEREQRLQVIKWERVDPNTLNPSPYTVAASDLSPAETPLLIPSPSWLSRNTFNIEVSRLKALNATQHLAPPSPAPLPILPRSLRQAYSNPASPIERPIALEHPDSPLQSQSDGSSVTLYSSSKPILRISPPTPRASANRLSVFQYRNSPSESRRSLQSFLSYASAALSGKKENPLITVGQDSPTSRFFLLLHSQSVEPSPIDSAPSPLPLPINVTFDPYHTQSPTGFSEHYELYRPTPRAFEESKDTFPLPNYLRALIRSVLRDSSNYANMSADAYGKPADTVDWGDEVDYSNYEWFKNPPSPRHHAQPTTPPPMSEQYVPQPDVIMQNEAFEFALKSAPNVLYGRFKQYGQLGVLAWCSEFGEMIDAFKNLGFEGNMFVSTRTQALKTCEEILALNLSEEIEMQIIVMYLSSQVARLRRFLDSDKQYEDYPQPKFPVDHSDRVPHQH